MDAYMGKRFMMVQEENYNEYLQFIGIDKETCDLMLKVETFVCLTRDPDGKYCFTMGSEYGEIDYTFNLGEEFDEVGYDGGTNNSMPVSPCGTGISWLIKLKKFGDSFKKADPTVKNNSGRAVITIDGNTVTMIQRTVNGKISKSVAEYIGDKMLITTTALGFDKTVKRYFKLMN